MVALSFTCPDVCMSLARGKKKKKKKKKKRSYTEKVRFSISFMLLNFNNSVYFTLSIDFNAYIK